MVCGESDKGMAGGCSGLVTWEQGHSTCQTVGARLCTLEEMSSDETRGTGCAYDNDLLWTSTSCGDGSYFQGCGRSGNCGGNEQVCADATVASVEVRCCADVFSNSARPVPAPTAAPDMSPISAPVTSPAFAPVSPPTSGGISTCTDLGWGNAASYGSTSVCGESDLSMGGCSGNMVWAAAEAFCSSAGARMCTVAELQADEARGTGCGIDRTMVWSSDVCSGGYMAAPGSSKSGTTPICEAAGTLTNVARCCAEVSLSVSSPVLVPSAAPVMSPVPGPVSTPTSGGTSTCADLGWGNAATYGSTSVCGESDLSLGSCSGAVAWAVAEAFCSSAGARMCTMAELQADEARGTGCGIDRTMVWSSNVCSGGYMAAPGSSRSGTTPICEAAGTFTNAARCCAEVSLSISSPMPAPSRAPVTSPGPGPVSTPTSGRTFTCTDLGWGNAASYGSTSVCGESDLSLGGCSGNMVWAAAEAFCSSAGARMCTVAELLADEAKASGCGLDRKWVWSSDVCSGGYMLLPGSSRMPDAPRCESAGAVADGARCCASV